VVKFLADECCDALLVERLRAAGHDVLYIKDVSPGSPDDDVLRLACEQQRVLITEDKDFGEMVVRFLLPAFGIVLLRLDPADSEFKFKRTMDLLTQQPDRLAGSFIVVDEVKTRIRKLPGPRPA
jgi:predicted nuclease of predicted toxin-antitoxin system